MAEWKGHWADPKELFCWGLFLTLTIHSLVDMYFSSIVPLFSRVASIYKVWRIGILYYVLKPSPTWGRGREARYVWLKCDTWRRPGELQMRFAVLWTTVGVAWGLCYSRISGSIYAGAEYHELSWHYFIITVKLRYAALPTILHGKRFQLLWKGLC